MVKSSGFEDISKLKPWARNSRDIKPEDLERLKKQIKMLGQYKPLLINQDKIVLGGNMRLRAMQELGITNIWVSKVDTKTEADMLAYALSDNDRAGFYIEDDLIQLATEFKDKINLEDFKVDLKDAESLKDLVIAETPLPEDIDEIPEVKEPRVKSGEIWQLGNHRLMCGDATKEEDVKKLMNGEKADMVFTDPPYGVSYGKDNKPTYKDWGKIKNDSKTGEDLYNFLKDAISNLIVYTKSTSPFYFWSAPLQDGISSFKAISDSGIKIQSQIIWVKNHFAMARNDYHWMHEICWYGYKEKEKHNWFGARDKTTVWNIAKDASQKYEHPTQKPVALAVHALQNSAELNSIILDLFGGSGSTLIACEQTERICYMMELEPTYCDVIISRFEKFTGKKAKKVEEVDKK